MGCKMFEFGDRVFWWETSNDGHGGFVREKLSGQIVNAGTNFSLVLFDDGQSINCFNEDLVKDGCTRCPEKDQLIQSLKLEISRLKTCLGVGDEPDLMQFIKENGFDGKIGFVDALKYLQSHGMSEVASKYHVADFLREQKLFRAENFLSTKPEDESERF
jgi:hypothetical protein